MERHTTNMKDTRMNKKLIVALRDYCNNTLAGKCPDEGTGVLSALVNTIDTIREGNLPLSRRQVYQETQIVEYILAHDNNNRYEI